eukprot:COSAG05_NODE_620_length_8305_cov_87.859493_6_plen_41_part_00
MCGLRNQLVHDTSDGGGSTHGNDGINRSINRSALKTRVRP